MQQAYKCEFFTRAFEYRDMSVIGAPIITVDYISAEKVDISVYRQISALRGDYARITDQDGAEIYQGIVADISHEKEITAVSLLPLISLFDVESSYNIGAYTGDVEGALEAIIADLYINNEDTLQRLEGLTVIRTSSTAGTLTAEGDVYQLWELATQALIRFEIVISAAFNIQQKKLTVEIGKSGDSGVTIDSGLPNIIDSRFVFAANLGAVNKLIVLNSDDAAQRSIWYLHKDGSVGQTETDRITPVVWKYDSASAHKDQTFDQTAEAIARERLVPSKVDNLIVLTLLRQDKLIGPDALKIGQTVSILRGDTQYTGVLTGLEHSPETVRLTFGVLRLELTKILKMERRKTKWG
mgnify:CR=1 FL=1